MNRAIAFLDRFARDSLGSLGLSLKRMQPLDLRDITQSPIAARYLAGSRSALLLLPLERCRGFGPLGFPFDADTYHPLVLAVRHLRNNGTIPGDINPLQIYHEKFQPESAAEVLGFSERLSTDFEKAKQIESIEPWDPRSIENLIFDQKAESRNDSGMNLHHGHTYWGPMSPKRYQVEINRITKLIRNIEKNGYRRHDGVDGDICGTILVKGQDWACCIRRGQHRAAVMAALGHSHVPVRIETHGFGASVYRQDAHQWPHVRSGFYTLEQATAIFDRIFEGRPPAAACAAAQAAGRNLTRA